MYGEREVVDGRLCGILKGEGEVAELDARTKVETLGDRRRVADSLVVDVGEGVDGEAVVAYAAPRRFFPEKQHAAHCLHRGTRF